MTKQLNHRFLAALAVVLALALVAGVIGPAAAQEKKATKPLRPRKRAKTRSPKSCSSWGTTSAGCSRVATTLASWSGKRYHRPSCE